MVAASGAQILGLVDGGSANGGQDVHLKLRLTDGEQQQDVGFFIQHDLVPVVIAGLATFGGMARNTRLSKNPHEEADGSYAATHALNFADAFGGRSITQPDRAVLTIQMEALGDRRLNMHVAFDKAGLAKLANACALAAQQLEADDPERPVH